MTNHPSQPSGAHEPRDHDPWAAPEQVPPPSGATGPTTPPYPSPHVHDQPTIAAMPGAVPQPPMGAVPPPPVAPGGPAAPPAGPYGYPAAPAAPQPTSGYAPYPGYSAYGQPGHQPMLPQQNGLGTTAMVLGIVATVLFCLYGVLSIILGIMAVVFGSIGRKRVRQGEADNGGMALSGIILGVIGIVLGVLYIAVMVWGLTSERI